MPTNEHLVLCSGASAKPRGDEKPLTLNLHGASANARLEIEDISRRLLANLSHDHVDLLEIASYIYAADSAISRGGKTDLLGRDAAPKISLCNSGTSARIVVI